MTADFMQMARRDPERQLILRHADGMPGLVQLVLSDRLVKLLYCHQSSPETMQLCFFLSFLKTYQRQNSRQYSLKAQFSHLKFVLVVKGDTFPILVTLGCRLP